MSCLTIWVNLAKSSFCNCVRHRVLNSKKGVEGKSQFSGLFLLESRGEQSAHRYPRKRKMLVDQPLCSNELLHSFEASRY